MTIILALTVGGSCVPIVAAVRDYAPDHTCFIATSGPRGSRVAVDGPGKPCGRPPEKEINIVKQLGLMAEQYRVVELADPDALADIYAACRAALRQLAAERPDARLIADYTGGSKSMGVGLALAALEAGWQLSLVKGMRTDLVQVADGTEMAGLVNAWELRARQRMDEARRLFNAYAYASAGELLESLLRQSPLSAALDQTIRTWVACCRGFDAWDRFDHARAAQLLRTVPGQGIPWRFLKALTGEINTRGYEPVLDLTLNAERRAGRGRYDDAVARLYRAIEMLAQKRLLERDPPLDSSDLRLDKLPEAIRSKYQQMRQLNQVGGREDRVKIGLLDDYVLLAELNDPLGQVYQPLAGRLRQTITKRNQSILAHGITPLARSDYDEMRAVVDALLGAGLAALNVNLAAPQFPHLTASGLERASDASS